MDKILFNTMLYDFYSNLLTDKQKDMFELYYFNDFSLSEISNKYNISRQAVQDSIKRTEKLLFNYENKLLLLKKYSIQKEILDLIISEIENIIKCEINKENKNKLNKIKNKVIELIN